jgi:hypothetical protein
MTRSLNLKYDQKCIIDENPVVGLGLGIYLQIHIETLQNRLGHSE